MLVVADLLGVLAMFVLAVMPVQWIQKKILPWPEWTIIPVFAGYTLWITLSAGLVGYAWSLM